jgi:hypothetical protein
MKSRSSSAKTTVGLSYAFDGTALDLDAQASNGLGVSRIELVHQHLSVRLDPALYSLSRLHPEDLYPCRRNKSTAGGSAHELALVCPSIRPTYTTRSPSAMTSSTDVMRSGKAAR